jgi:ABC-type uncharacterized transport system fused permease/ATPase subunit
MRRLKAILKGWDLWTAIIFTIIVSYFLPDYINMKFTLSFYNVAMTVLSIIFSLFFTAMAIIMSSSDNDFIEFLEQKNTFTELLWSFKLTLLVLFISLISSILLYTGTSYWLETYSDKIWFQNKYLLLFLLLIFSYGMAATWACIMDTIRFSKYRSEFLSDQKKTNHNI